MPVNEADISDIGNLTTRCRDPQSLNPAGRLRIRYLSCIIQQVILNSQLYPFFLFLSHQNTFPMDQAMINLLIALLALLVSFYTFYLLNQQRKVSKTGGDSFTSRPLQLQAYERLVMLAERISIPNLVSRANQPGLDARQMQILLLDSIKQEYEYNTTQQIYVSPVAWEAIRNLKEQNMLIINQVGSTLPPGASGLDMNKRLMEFILASKKGTLHELVLEALNYEAKKILK